MTHRLGTTANLLRSEMQCKRRVWHGLPCFRIEVAKDNSTNVSLLKLRSALENLLLLLCCLAVLSRHRRLDLLKLSIVLLKPLGVDPLLSGNAGSSLEWTVELVHESGDGC